MGKPQPENMMMALLGSAMYGSYILQIRTKSSAMLTE